MTAAIRLDSLNLDLRVRAALDDDLVSEYAELLAQGVVLPPVVFYETPDDVRYLVDGFHRVGAAERLGWKDIDAEGRAAKDKNEALWFALGANKTHGRRMSRADVRYAIGLAVRAFPDKGPSVLALQVGCSDRYVREVRHQVADEIGLPDTVSGADGRQYSTTRLVSRGKRRTAAHMARAGASNADIQRETKGISLTTIAVARAAAQDERASNGVNLRVVREAYQWRLEAGNEVAGLTAGGWERTGIIVKGE